MEVRLLKQKSHQSKIPIFTESSSPRVTLTQTLPSNFLPRPLCLSPLLPPHSISSSLLGAPFFLIRGHGKSTIMGTNHHLHHHTTTTKPFLIKKLIPWALYVIIPLAILHLYLSSPVPPPNPTTTTTSAATITTSASPSSSTSTAPSSSPETKVGLSQPPPRWAPCNYSDGRWVPHSGGPRYDGFSCKTIKEGQNCMAHGRPDTGYLHWRWQPRQCPLPAFDPASLLRLIENKHLAFVGDSMARNQLESLICLLSTGSEPDLVYRDGEENKFRRWVFRGHNATVSVLWSPFLVKGIEKREAEGLNHNMLFLETADERWVAELERVDVAVLSIGHWYLTPTIYHENGVVLGCHHCPGSNYTEIRLFDMFRKATRTALGEIVTRYGASPSEKLVVVTTFSPAHFEGEWDKAGACAKREPYKEGEKRMEYLEGELRRIAVGEVAAATERAERGGLLIETLDVTEMALMRPDGHPGPYMHPNPFADGEVKERVQNDCVHWCLPGPVDSWNEILLQIVKNWKGQGKFNS